MNKYLITFYFVNGSVYAIRLDDSATDAYNIYRKYLTKLGNICIGNEIINLNNVMRYVIEKLEGDEDNVHKQ